MEKRTYKYVKNNPFLFITHFKSVSFWSKTIGDSFQGTDQITENSRLKTSLGGRTWKGRNKMDCSYIFISSLSILCLGFGGCRLILSKILRNLIAYVQNISGKSLFYDNCRNSRALIGLYLLSVCGQTYEFKIHATLSEREPAIRQFVIVKNKLMLVFNASVLLLIMNFVMTLSK